MKSNKDPFTPIDVSNLQVVSNERELRRDIHVFVDYVQDREVKRSHRSNALGKADSKRMAKLMTDCEAVREVDQKGYSVWVNLIDSLALNLGFVNYDTKGSYAGYSSSEPSFPDNYIECRENTYQIFLEQSIQKREQVLLDRIVGMYGGCSNEFFVPSRLGRLDAFDRSGCATGVTPSLDFANIRRFLLKLLSQCDPGVWYSTSGLISYLKSEHPYFLIPEKPAYRYRWEEEKGRYCNFKEGKKSRWDSITIPKQAPDVFERVEGRYIERFLENIPLIFRYIEVAYTKEAYKGLFPRLGCLKAFRVTTRFVHFMENKVSAPKVTVQPNFELHVESLFYPVTLLSQLFPLTEIVSENNIIILKLTRQKVVAHLVENEELDVITLLTELTGRELPENIETELQEWTDHTENFILYEGFGLLEGEKNEQTSDSFTIEEITPNLRIVHSPKVLYERLEQAELVPFHIEHANSNLQPLPEKTITLFPKISTTVARPKQKQSLTLRRQMMVILHFPDSSSLEKVNKRLLDTRCLVMADKRNLTLTYNAQYEKQVASVLRELKKHYAIRIHDESKKDTSKT